jgi:hypothetical protein
MDHIENTFYYCTDVLLRNCLANILLLSRNFVRVAQQWVVYKEYVFAGTCLTSRCLAVGRYVTIFLRNVCTNLHG